MTKLLIAGPCSAESRDQVYNTALELKSCNIDYFRAGIWKPRTRPGGFEGIGVSGLKWLQEIQEEIGVKVITEIAQPEHIELCLAHNIRAFWIGARSTSNPFSITKLADALKNMDVTVGIKNPISSDLDLWIGAIERIQQAGIKNIFAIHRGFYQNNKNKYRNNPIWGIPIELKRRFPKLKIICDPSHIGGNPNLIQTLSQQSMDLLFDGLMIESHINPKGALTDAFQQIKPARLKKILNELILKNHESYDVRYLFDLENFRRKIDSCDYEIMDYLKLRMDAVKTIGKIKNEKNISALQPNRWKQLIADRIKHAHTLGLPEDLILKIFINIHEESLKLQSGIK